ncbi:7159_t:CDS:1, partial [Funneliformis geosporum]
LIKGRNTHISSLIPDNFRSLVMYLRKYSLLFIEQLVFSKGDIMLTFGDFNMQQGLPLTGRIPH